MNKVITISLNGRAYQLEEDGYEALRAYLDDARAKLAGNPDAEEVMRDLEQAIADKLVRLMGAHRSVGNGADVKQALDEMGPVDGEDRSAGESHAHASAPGAGPKRFYRLKEGAVFAGVCSGIAAYFGIDPLIVRLGFVALAIVTGGGAILLYFLMVVFVPKARTPQEKARATGMPFNAEEIMREARESFAQLKQSGREWKQYAREQKRQAHAHKKALKNAWKWHAYGMHQGRAWQGYGNYAYVRRGPTVLEEVIQLAIIAAILWAVYTYIPASQPAFHYVGNDIQQGWAWLNAKVAK
ncbi:MAG TPA: PspC domain-containing protein [Candidatus Paceibacterota bacterium]|nr:PspC domain-containing protein [Candidatus Paceibacterota bacterium]